MPNGSGCVRMPEVGKPNSSMLTGKTAICRNWRVCQRSLPNNPILLLPRRRRPPIRRHASRRDISASHLPIEIKWEQCNRREKPPIVHSQDQSNWRQLVGWNRKSKKCNALVRFGEQSQVERAIRRDLRGGCGEITTDCSFNLALLTEPHVEHCTSWTFDSSQRAASNLIGPENEQWVASPSCCTVPT